MKFNFSRLGEYIEEVDNRNLWGEQILLLGIQKKWFSRHKNDLPDHNMKDCKVVLKNQFCYVPVTSRNGDRLSIALLQGIEKASVSKTYLVFRIKDTNILQEIYLMMWFKKKEFDRYARYHSYGSAREIFKGESLCDFLIPDISFEKQSGLVEELNRLEEQIKAREALSEKLKRLLYFCKRYFYDSKNEGILAENVRLVQRKNKNNEVRNSIGVSGQKIVIDYKGVVKDEDFTKLHVVQKDEFIGNPECYRICALTCGTENSPALVSNSYYVFSIVDKKLLSVGYLMACFFDPEFDRYATFHSGGSNRDRFKPSCLLNFKISFIDSEIQTLFTYLYELFLINQKIISLSEKRRAILFENFEYLLQD